MEGKRLLLLGGTSASLDVVKNAKEMGVYTIATDYLPSGVAKDIADEQAMVSTTDIDGLAQLIKERNIDGVFCGPSEFNIRNLILLCEKTGLPCYTSMRLWDQCANKDEFKQFCINYDVDCPRLYDVDENSSDEILSSIDYPIIVKPVDGASSRGITVCTEKSQVHEACRFARQNSKSKRILAEKYIDNGGEMFGARYIIRDGEAFLLLLTDIYIVDPINRKSLISHFFYAPSKYTDYYMKNVDPKVRKMLKGMGLKNGTAFFQTLPYNGKIYFHEMAYRLGGELSFKLSDPLAGINDVKMLIRFALGEPILTAEEETKLKNLDFNFNGKIAAQLCVPLKAGTIASVEGLEKIKALPVFKDFLQYYRVGDSVLESRIGTLGQHFGRITFTANSAQEVEDTVKMINSTLFIRDTNGNIMNSMHFDFERTKR